MNQIVSIPHDWSEIEVQVREAIIAMASILQNFGPQDNGATVTAFFGLPVEIAGRGWMSVEEIEGIDFTRHGLYRHARAAWCYAYQLEGWENFTVEYFHEIACGLLSGGYALTDSEGEPTGLDFRNDMPLRRVFETAYARWDWTKNGSDLTVRQLSLLSSMAEATVRSSLSKEGFKLEPPKTVNPDNSSHTLSANDAVQWLSRRRGFIQNAAGSSPERYRMAIRETLADLSIPFPTVVKRISDLAGLSEVNGPKVDRQWYAGLVDGRAVAPDLEALVALADAFDVPRADFAARGVRHLLELESS